MHSTIATELNLSRAPQDAYKYRRWGRKYDIVWVDPAAFANRLTSGFQGLFPGRRVALTTATLHIGAGDEQVKSYFRLESFLQDLRKAEGLSELHLTAEGPRGEFISVYVERDLRQMELRAFADFDRFEAFAGELKHALRRMKLREKDDLDVAGGAPKGKTFSNLEIAGGVAGWFLALIVGILGTDAYKARREAPELTIDSPRAIDGLAEVQSADVTISWTHKQPRMFDRPQLDTGHEAEVHVARESDGIAVMDQKHRGNARLTGLAEGSYTIRVTAEGAYKTLVLKVKPRPPAE